MKIIVPLYILTTTLGASNIHPDILEIKGFKDIPRELKTHSTVKIKIDLPPETTSQLISLGCATSGLIIMGARMVINGSQEGQTHVAPLAVGAGLIMLGLLLNWNKQGTSDETTQKDQEQPHGANTVNRHPHNLSSKPSNLL